MINFNKFKIKLNKDELYNKLLSLLDEDELIKEYFIKGYYISSKGKVFGIKKSNITQLKPSYNNNYLQVILINNGYRITKMIHRLVAECFIPNPNNYPQINHKDENRQNNNVSNLEWCTCKYNTVYSQAKKVKQICPKTKRIINIFDSSHDAEKAVGASKGEVSNCCRHRRNQTKVKGYIFEYV